MEARSGSVHAQYPNMFSPIQVGPVEIRNRFYFAPHGVGLAVSTKPARDFPYYSAERVKGGCGLVINSLTVTERGTAYQSSAYPEENIPSFRALSNAIHDAGGKIFGELWYWWGVTGQWRPLSPAAPSLGASVRQFRHGRAMFATHQAGRGEIRRLIDAYRQSAANLRQAGYDGVMLHSAHGAILEHFLSPYFNERTDEYGGSFENRIRLLMQCLEAAREGTAGEMAVGVRLNCDELLPGGYGTAEAERVVRRICSSGLVDFVDLDIAIEPSQLYLGMPNVFVAPHVYKPYVEKVRGAAGTTPVFSVLGRLTSIADGEAAIAAGICDMVGAARALIAEPELVKNAYEGAEERSRTCIACNWCLEASGHGAAGCAINPASYRERSWGAGSFTPATRSSRVVVVGGGPAGLEAARVSALLGHHVTLFEARDGLGGAFALWSGLPGRGAFTQATDWWQRELERLGVEIRLGTAATAESVLAERPDAVIVATGSLYSAIGRSAHLDAAIPGCDQEFVHTVDEVLVSGLRPQGRVIVLDGEGSNAGLGTAEVLASAGAIVELVTPNLSPVSASLEGTTEVGFVMKRLKEAGVQFSVSTYIRAIGDHEVTVYDVFTEGERRIADVAAVVLSTGREPVSALAEELDGKVAQLYSAGDALAPRMWSTAAYEGHMFARFIGEPDAPANVEEAWWAKVPPEHRPQPAEVLLELQSSHD
jgi:2,4-dienoyl-CoA reductase-like NADH-dependent reductase (Old Yellow Enzyme family)/pyruvate/2-oxoglutarate dehydrogenase complex dihydrolipoamide dehydrogenase (E3) component